MLSVAERWRRQRRGGGGGDGEELGGKAHGAAGKDQGSAVGGGDGRVIVATHDLHGPPTGNLDAVDGRLSGIVRGEVELGGVRSPGNGVYPAVEVLGEVE